MISFTYEWEREYVAAILETDNATLATLIAVAESTMLARVGKLNRGSCRSSGRALVSCDRYRRSAIAEKGPTWATDNGG